MEPRPMYGRKPIYTDVDEVTEENIFAVLGAAWPVHEKNRDDIQYLWDYYKGKQPILMRIKEVRPEILNKIVENRANEIVEFKSGYLIGEPVQYVGRSEADAVSEAVLQLNDFMFSEDKDGVDKEIVDWFHICGTSYRCVLPESGRAEDEAPFSLYALDPRGTFIIYHRGIGHRPMLGVTYVVHADNSLTISAYTKTRYYEINYGDAADVGLALPPLNGLTRNEGHLCGDIPIIEYPANKARLGAFEIVLPILDAVNDMTSNRTDAIEQIVQALLVFEGLNIDDEQFNVVKKNGAVCLPEGTKAYYIAQELNQTQTQTFVDYLDQQILLICGMPNRNGGSSTSDTGSAVLLRDGWSDAEARARDSELMFKKSEKQFLRIVLNIVKTMRDIDLSLSEVEIRFTRRNYENIQSKAQVLTTMLANDKIHPRLAFEHCGMFVDAELAYKESMEYYDEAQARAVDELNEFTDAETERARAEANNGEEETQDV